jgi:ABC-type sugar transport system substrate-binding protein
LSFHLPSLLSIVASYLIGSLSFAVIVSRALGMADPRSYGSGNPGATNVLRSGNKGAALATLLLDALKGQSIGTDKVQVVGIDGTTDAVAAVAAGDLLVTVGGGYACGAFALTELYDYLNGFPVTQPEYNLPLLPVTKDNAQAYQDQVLNGMNSYDFKSVSAVYTPGATQKDYAIVLH